MLQRLVLIVMSATFACERGTDEPGRNAPAGPPAEQLTGPAAGDKPVSGHSRAEFAVDAYSLRLSEIEDRLIEAKRRFNDADSEPERSQAEEEYREVRVEHCVYRRPAALLLPEVCTRDPFDPGCNSDVPLRDVTAEECRVYHARFEELEAQITEARERRDNAANEAERTAAEAALSGLNGLRCYLSPPISMHRKIPEICLTNPIHPSCDDDAPRTRCETAMDLANRIETRVREDWNQRSRRRSTQTEQR